MGRTICSMFRAQCLGVCGALFKGWTRPLQIYGGLRFWWFVVRFEVYSTPDLRCGVDCEHLYTRKLLMRLTILGDNRLTSKQREFAVRVANGLRVVEAAEMAGYASPRQDAWKLQQLPHVIAAIRKFRTARINGNMATTALQTMEELMTDKDHVPAPTRFKAAQWVLKEAGHGQDEREEGQDRPLDELSQEELQKLVTTGMDTLSELARQLQGGQIIDGSVKPVKEIKAERVQADYATGEESTDFLD